MVFDNQSVQDKSAVAALLHSQMNLSYSDLRDNSQLSRNRYLVKTYVIEFTPGENSSITDLNEDKIETLFSFKSKKQEHHPVIQTTGDRSLYVLRWKYNDNDIEAYLDISPVQNDCRFWFLDSVSKADVLDIVIKKIINQSTELDRIWIWPSLLKEFTQKGQLRGFDLTYDYRKFETQENISQAEYRAEVEDPPRQVNTRPVEEECESTVKELKQYLTLSARGGGEVSDALHELFQTDSLQEKVVPSKISIKYRGEENSIQRVSQSNFAIETIQYDGKFVVKGTSVLLHKELVNEIRSRYSTKIRDIEKRHIIKIIGKEDKITDAVGEPLYFNFESKPIENLIDFCKVVFSGKDPFFLWGVPREVDDGLIVHSIDLKTGSKMNFQIYRDVVSLSLELGSCGNSVVRFFTNIQQSFSCRITAEDADGVSVF
ncbi:hypothetical protein C1752_07854 [Acaryochloris thomasi RCC1774]|uniref:Uncharacterized protein n=1 Tax=Acaryochloris thomasi RCC1774 TaxID=1764569 RepID=A0A2W1JAY3_9CYAN|nr:hypothetical protein [Acaryochloris thomasi]PZD71126.1 hypothetical protein C1752_07854 [Acaryochloris thomasi RCC1774]